MKNKNTITKVLLLLLIAGVVYVIFFHKQKPTHILDPNVQWKTDTLKVPEPYPVPEPYEVKVPPRIIKIYEVDSSAIDSLKILMQNDSILINGLKSQISIHKNYLKQYPNNPKLIGLNLLYDTLSLSLLNTDGLIFSKSYPIFIEFFKYDWSAGELTREDNKRNIPQPKKYLTYKAGGGYDLLYLTPYIQGEISKDVYKFEVYGRVGFGLLNNKSSELKLGINYKLGKNVKD